MYKLNDKKIRWIINAKKQGRLTNNEIARVQGVSVRRVQQLWRAYKMTGKYPTLKKSGRPRRGVTFEELCIIFEAYGKYKQGAQALEKIIAKKYNRNIPHNLIHKILKENGLAKEEKKKKLKRTWVRYERKYSMELWHTDWKYIRDMGKWIIAYLDDASRFITAYGLFDSPTTENSIAVLKKGIEKYGTPREILTDRGPQFYANAGTRKAKGECEFEKFLRENGIRHIVARVNHPQTNGKIEIFYSNVITRKLREFNSVDEAITWYNEIRPHMSLGDTIIVNSKGERELMELETPSEAFRRKLPPEYIMYYAKDWLWK